MTLAQEWTNINHQKTAHSEKLHRAKPQPYCSLQERPPSGEGRKAAFGVLRESAAERLQVESSAKHSARRFHVLLQLLPGPSRVAGSSFLQGSCSSHSSWSGSNTGHSLPLSARTQRVREQQVPSHCAIRSSAQALPSPGLLLLLKICSPNTSLPKLFIGAGRGGQCTLS